MALLRGHVESMNSLGCMLEKGEGCEQNYSAAAEWYRRAASHGNVTGKVNLGLILAHGYVGDQTDHEQANTLFCEAIARGNIRALYSMGMSHYRGVKSRNSTFILAAGC